MTARTFNELFDQPITLAVEQEGRNWIVCDGDAVYLRTPDIQFAIRFMAAMERKRDARIDDRSVERAAWLAAQAATYSVRVPDNVYRLRPAVQIDEEIA